MKHVVSFSLILLFFAFVFLQTIQASDQLVNRLQGYILLQVEQNGEAWYLDPSTKKRFFLNRPNDAFLVMRSRGIGISDADISLIPIGLTNISGLDFDLDGLPDAFENAIGTDIAKKDSDGDGFNDFDEVSNRYNPTGNGRQEVDLGLTNRLLGKILLQVENHGEAWYLDPQSKKRYFLGRPKDAFSIMKSFGLGITNQDLTTISISEESITPEESSASSINMDLLVDNHFNSLKKEDYLISLTEIPVQTISTGKVVTNKHEAYSALESVSDQFKNPSPVGGTFFDGGVVRKKIGNGYVISITILYTEDNKGAINNYYVSSNGDVSFYGSVTSLQGVQSLDGYTEGYGSYWDLSLLDMVEYVFAYSKNVIGDDITSVEYGNNICENEFGEGWFWVDYHINSSNFKGKFLSEHRSDESWTWINDQVWECFERGNKSPYKGEDSWPDISNSGMIIKGTNSYNGFSDFEWKKIGHGGGFYSASCTDSLPLLCAYSNNIDNYTAISSRVTRQENYISGN